MVQINIDLTVVVRILRVALRVVEEAISMTRGPKRKPPAGTQKRLEGLKEEIMDVVEDLTSSKVYLPGKVPDHILSFIQGMRANSLAQVTGQSRVYESQVDMVVNALLHHYFDVNNLFWVHNQWRYNMEVHDQSMLDAIDAFSLFVEADETPPVFEETESFIRSPRSSTSHDTTDSNNDGFHHDFENEFFSSTPTRPQRTTVEEPSPNGTRDMPANTSGEGELFKDIGTFVFPSPRPEERSGFSHVGVDLVGRLVHNDNRVLGTKVPDFVVSQKEVVQVIIENKMRKKSAAVKQLHLYMQDHRREAPGHVGFAFVLGETGLEVAMFKWTVGAETPDWIGATGGLPCWYAANSTEVLDKLAEISKMSIDDLVRVFIPE